MKFTEIILLLVSIVFIFGIYAFSPYVQLFIFSPSAFINNWIYLLMVLVLFGGTYYLATKIWTRTGEKRWFVYYVLLTIGITLAVINITSMFLFQKDSVQFIFVIESNDSNRPPDTVHFICSPIDTDSFIADSRIECEATAVDKATLNGLTLFLKIDNEYTNLSEGFWFDHTVRQNIDYFTSQNVMSNPGKTTMTANITMTPVASITALKTSEQITVLDGPTYLKKIFVERFGLIAAVFLFSLVSMSSAIKNIRDLYHGK